MSTEHPRRGERSERTRARARARTEISSPRARPGPRPSGRGHRCPRPSGRAHAATPPARAQPGGAWARAKEARRPATRPAGPLSDHASCQIAPHRPGTARRAAPAPGAAAQPRPSRAPPPSSDGWPARGEARPQLPEKSRSDEPSRHCKVQLPTRLRRPPAKHVGSGCLRARAAELTDPHCDLAWQASHVAPEVEFEDRCRQSLQLPTAAAAASTTSGKAHRWPCCIARRPHGTSVARPAPHCPGTGGVSGGHRGWRRRCHL
mmetsp:Transcript_50887/g.144201  ORF Transcript_50887/g.144201 Transcript_50887/m.144201 type:complete len:262 (-) Transcript_50887:1752-2537(-)